MTSEAVYVVNVETSLPQCDDNVTVFQHIESTFYQIYWLEFMFKFVNFSRRHEGEQNIFYEHTTYCPQMTLLF